MLDGVRYALQYPSKPRFDFENAPFALVSIHRFENIFTSRFTDVIVPILKDIAKTCHLVFVLHPPTRERIQSLGLLEELSSDSKITFHARFGFIDWVNLCSQAKFVITDGGSNQEELSYLGVPTLLFRYETERQEGLGENVIVSGFDKNVIGNFINNPDQYRRQPLLSHAKPSEKIVQVICTTTNQQQEPDVQAQLSSGIPKDPDYRLLIQSERYKAMEKFSDSFLSINRKFLENYAKRWVRDSLHQWSRQWEYPYVFNRVETIIKNRETSKILDAGSGITFFPYFLKSLYPSMDVYCADNDTNLESIYQQINMHGPVQVNFSCSDLKKLPFALEQFDVVYCVSVLEHTDDYAGIIEEFHKVLRPGGRLVITFDISLDGTRDISVEKGTRLLNSLAEKFDIVEDVSFELGSDVSASDVFTTHTAKEIDPNLLPWKLPQFVYRLNSFLRGSRFGTWPPLLTVFCLNMEKRA